MQTIEVLTKQITRNAMNCKQTDFGHNKNSQCGELFMEIHQEFNNTITLQVYLTIFTRRVRVVILCTM